MKLQVYRAVIHWWMIVHFEYFDEWFSKSAFSNTNLKRESKNFRTAFALIDVRGFSPPAR